MLAAAALLFACAQAGDPEPRGWSGFPVIVYRQQYSGRELPPALAAPFGGVHLKGPEEAPWAFARGLDFYVEHAAGRGPLHLDREDPRWSKPWKRWIETRDPAFALRDPCLSDPVTVAGLERELERTLAARAGRFGLGYSLGDEVSLTPAGQPAEVCLSPACRAAWTAYLAEHGLAERAQQLGYADPARASTDAALDSLRAGRTSELEGWFLRRRFHHDVVLDLLERLAARAREQRPGAPIGLMGLSGESAFGNVAVERVLPFLDFVETYRTGDATELLFTLRRPGQRALRTVFPVRAAPEAWAWEACEHWLRGGDGLVVWSDRELEESPPLAASLARATATIRALRERLPEFVPRPVGVALVHGADAIAGDWLLDARADGATWPNRMQTWQAEHGRREIAMRLWLEALEDCGAMPGALPLAQIGAAAVERFPLLVAAELAVLDDADVARLAEYLRAGGRLIVDGDLGLFDARGAAPARPALERLRAAAPGRVLDAPGGLRAYLPERPEATRAALAGRLAVAGVERAPWRWRGACATRPFLSSFARGADGAWTCAALPKFRGVGRWRAEVEDAPQREGDPAALEPVALELDAPAGFAVEWILPPADGEGRRVLAPGQPAVFRLVPRER